MDSHPAPSPLPSTTTFRLQPISASAIAEGERRRRNEVRDLGPCLLGCSEVDEQVLLGGLERGCVVGVSAEEEDPIGVAFGLQVLVSSLLANPSAVRHVMIITPKPQGVILRALRGAAENGLKAQGAAAGEELEKEVRKVLERVMLSCVFDFDELWAVLADLDRPPPATTPSPRPTETSPRRDGNSPAGDKEEEDGATTSEIGDSQDDDASLTPPSRLHTAPAPKPEEPKLLPDIILITHFSAILTSLFTSRDNQSAHTALRLASSHLRHLTRSLPSHPLVLLLNSTTTESSEARVAGSEQQQQRGSSGRPSDPTLRSIFSPPPLALSGYAYAAAARRNKPSFGLVFSQMLDMHLLLTKMSKSRGEAADSDGRAHAEAAVRTGGAGGVGPARSVTAVEVLLDEMGVWNGELGARKDREQRWGVVDYRDGGLVDGTETKREAVYKELVLSAGFGGRRH